MINADLCPLKGRSVFCLVLFKIFDVISNFLKNRKKSCISIFCQEVFKMKKSLLTIICIIFICLAAAVYIIISNSSNNITKAQGDPAKDLAKERLLLGDGRDEEAIELLKKVINENPGTPYEAGARFELAGIYGFMKKDGAKMVNEYEKVARDFAGTRYGLRAKAYLINSYYLKEGLLQTWIEKANDLIVENGGVSINKILSSPEMNSDEWWDKIHALNPELRDTFIPDMYREIADTLEDPEINRGDQRIKIIIFIRTYFPKYKGSWEQIDALRQSVVHKWKLYTEESRKCWTKDIAPPEICVISPRENLTTGNRRPKIMVKLSDGDLSQKQVDLSDTVFTLDDQDITTKMKVRIHLNTCGKVKHDLETIWLEYKPDAPLAPGKHTVYIKAMDSKDQASEKTWTFTVKEHSQGNDDKDKDKDKNDDKNDDNDNCKNSDKKN
jgi:hypothetical protein